ncbi:hypothetical protein B0H14DRAFT_2593184 [Mycena olivaceomarginata]|nr:hypothetical protein B0H14DRAFT_2593184 [Mycena olivaceomarginata]
MSSSKPAARTSQNDAPYAKQRRRALMACTNCRKRKMRCITTEQPPTNPCARCTKKGLPCEYVSAEDDSTPGQSPNLVSSALPGSGGHSRHPSLQAPARPMSASNDFSRAQGMAPPLPYTGPPPLHGRPRYSGSAQYPDLSLSGQGSSHQTSQQYYPTQANNPLTNQGYNPQAYQYMANNAQPAGQPGMYPPGTGGYPPNYRQMQYYGDTPMPDYQWPPRQG